VRRAAQRRGELRVGDRRRRREVDRPGDVAVIQHEPDGPHVVGQGDPAQVLAAAAEPGPARDALLRMLGLDEDS